MELRDVIIDALTKPTKGGKVPIVEVECGPWTAADLAQHLAAAIYPVVDVPTEPGTYFWRDSPGADWETYWFQMVNGRLVEFALAHPRYWLEPTDPEFLGDNPEGEWHGPIPTPGGG